MFDTTLLIADLERDESFRPVVYDDATGKPIGPGSILQGHPTTGIGWALDVNPLSHDRAKIICSWHVDDKMKELFAALPWAAYLSEPRCRALMNMAFNMGVHELLKFHNMLEALRVGRWVDAAKEAKASLWFKQVGDRGKRIVATFETGI